MHYYEVAPAKIIRIGSEAFTYQSDTTLAPGAVVAISVGKKPLAGVVLRAVKKPAFTTKPIGKLLESQPLPRPLLTLARWLSEYYATPLATVLQTVLPRGVGKNRRRSLTLRQVTTAALTPSTQLALTSDQSAAIDRLDTLDTGTALLHGITGSGKTTVYIDQVRKMLAAGRSAIVLVPEIALTSQIVTLFRQEFGDRIIVTHSRQTEAERHLVWRRSLQTTTPLVAIGPRSALFLPLANLGLIVIDEMHEPSFKQEQSPRYSALRAGSILAQAHQAKLILGSATPPIAEYYLAEQRQQPIITMNTLARPNATKPRVALIDMTKKSHFSRHRFLSSELLTQLEQTFANGKQALIFHNRRGSAGLTLCDNCGWQAGCPRCYVPLTLHGDRHELRCHICGYHERVPTSCPVCRHTEIFHKGIGTKLIESELKKFFPTQTIARFDGDTEDKAGADSRYDELHRGDIDLIIGTQVIAKGFDLPELRTVGVVQADAGLALPDYSASERTFQLITQVVGRVGRSAHTTNVIVQSYQPTHPAVTLGLAQNYQEFYTDTLHERARALFPPYCFLLKLTCTYKTEAAAVRNAQKLALAIRQIAPKTVDVLGPTPSFYERQRDTYRWQLTLKSPRRAELVALLAHVPTPYWQYELDPISLLS